MSESKELSSTCTEQQLLSKSAIKLPPKERLNLLLRAKRYPIVTKRTSAEGQIKEMIDFYNLCCLMLAQYFPNKRAENNFFLLNFITSQDIHEISNEKLSETFKLLNGYEELEKRITAIQALFYKYQDSFPDLYQRYNLEEYVFEKISDALETSRQMLCDEQSINKLLERWGIS